MTKGKFFWTLAGFGFALVSCSGPVTGPSTGGGAVAGRLAKYTTVRLTTDISVLTENQRRMIPLLIEAGRAMEMKTNE